MEAGAGQPAGSQSRSGLWAGAGVLQHTVGRTAWTTSDGGCVLFSELGASKPSVNQKGRRITANHPHKAEEKLVVEKPTSPDTWHRLSLSLFCLHVVEVEAQVQKGM